MAVGEYYHLAYKDLVKFWSGKPEFDIVPRRTVLLIHDVQGLTTDPEMGLIRRMAESRLDDLRTHYVARVRQALATIAAVRADCRAAEIQVIYTVIGARMADGRDLAWPLRQHGLVPLPGSSEMAIHPSLSPLPSEPVIVRGTFSVFTPAHGDEVLRNMGFDTLIIVGGLTNITLESSARDAADRAYRAFVVEDACFSISPRGHEQGIETLRLWFAHITSSERIRRKIADGRKAARVSRA